MTPPTRWESPRPPEELDRFFTLSLDLLCIAGLDGYFKRINPSWERTLGFTTQELLSKPYLDFIHPEDREATLAEAGKLAHGVHTVYFENRYQTKDGSYRWLGWTARAPGSGEDFIYAAARDITDRKRDEEAIRRLNEELEAFSYSVSHDLRAPLRHASGFVDLLEKHLGTTLDEKSRRYLRTIAEASRQMGRLIDDLLGFSKIGRVELRRECVPLGPMVEEVRRALAEDTKGRKIEWEVGPLPEVEGDPSLLKQALFNLLANAVKYTRVREEARIGVGTFRMDGRGAALFVRDNGAGFDMKYAGKLFGVFQRLHSAAEFEGTGIGLANVRRIIERHGGKVWAEGKVGEGATFYFTLPSEPWEAP